MRAEHRSLLGFAARVAVGGVLAAAGAFKASMPPEEFAYAIDTYHLVSSTASVWIAMIMPWVELMLGFSLILGNLTRPASAGAGVLLAAFSAALLSVKLRHVPLHNCGCFGTAFHPSLRHALLMDAVLLVLSSASFWSGREIWSWDLWAEADNHV